MDSQFLDKIQKVKGIWQHLKGEFKDILINKQIYRAAVGPKTKELWKTLTRVAGSEQLRLLKRVIAYCPHNSYLQQQCRIWPSRGLILILHKQGMSLLCFTVNCLQSTHKCIYLHWKHIFKLVTSFQLEISSQQKLNCNIFFNYLNNQTMSSISIQLYLNCTYITYW